MASRLCCYSPSRRAVTGARNDRVLRGHLALRGSSTGGDRATVPADRSFVIGSGWPGTLQGRWRVCRHSTRPVLKHGPRSLTCARVIGRYESQRRSESEGGPGLTQVGSLLVEGGAPPARPIRVVGGAEQERARWDPKDGELCLSRTKPEETLVEVRSDSDVQIDRQT